MCAGVADVPVLDAAARAAGLGRADADDPALRAAAADLHARAAHAQGRLRALPRVQRDIISKY